MQLSWETYRLKPHPECCTLQAAPLQGTLSRKSCSRRQEEGNIYLRTLPVLRSQQHPRELCAPLVAMYQVSTVCPHRHGGSRPESQRCGRDESAEKGGCGCGRQLSWDCFPQAFEAGVGIDSCCHGRGRVSRTGCFGSAGRAITAVADCQRPSIRFCQQPRLSGACLCAETILEATRWTLQPTLTIAEWCLLLLPSTWTSMESPMPQNMKQKARMAVMAVCAVAIALLSQTHDREVVADDVGGESGRWCGGLVGAEDLRSTLLQSAYDAVVQQQQTFLQGQPNSTVSLDRWLLQQVPPLLAFVARRDDGCTALLDLEEASVVAANCQALCGAVQDHSLPLQSSRGAS